MPDQPAPNPEAPAGAPALLRMPVKLLVFLLAAAIALPLVACMAYSVNKQGKLSEGVDVFGNVAWDATRLKAQQKGEAIRQQGFIGAAMLPTEELEYSAFRDSLTELEAEFSVRA